MPCYDGRPSSSCETIIKYPDDYCEIKDRNNLLARLLCFVSAHLDESAILELCAMNAEYKDWLLEHTKFDEERKTTVIGTQNNLKKE